MADSIKIRVSARNDTGFRRGGRFWTSEPTDAEVTSAEYEILKSEKQLVVLELDDNGDTADFAEKNSEIDALNTKVAMLKIQNDDLVKKVSDLEGKNGELERDLTGTSNEKIRLETEKADLVKKVSDLEGKVKELEKKTK